MDSAVGLIVAGYLFAAGVIGLAFTTTWLASFGREGAHDLALTVAAAVLMYVMYLMVWLVLLLLVSGVGYGCLAFVRRRTLDRPLEAVAVAAGIIGAAVVAAWMHALF